MKNFTKLSRKELSTVTGGLLALEDDGGKYKCCWKSDTSNCSTSVSGGSNMTCVKGAVLTPA